MPFETLIKRTIYKAKCPTCDFEKTLDTINPPKETLCMKCTTWIKFEELTYIGPELKQ